MFIIKFLKRLFTKSEPNLVKWQPEWSQFLSRNVSFYHTLSNDDKVTFERRVNLFLHTTEIKAGDQVNVTTDDMLLVASSAIIPVWGFPQWHYFNLKSVYLLKQSFNEDLQFGQHDSLITGMVGTGVMLGKLVLSKPHLHLGFKNNKDKRNVGIHEFVHLIDMADGTCDGFPERLKEFSFSAPWFDLVYSKIMEIEDGKSNIRQYGATNKAEFLSVASEYFFEQPQMLKRKHPKLFEALTTIYQQDVSHINGDCQTAKNAKCPCGSKKKYKRCCMPKD